MIFANHFPIRSNWYSTIEKAGPSCRQSSAARVRRLIKGYVIVKFYLNGKIY